MNGVSQPQGRATIGTGGAAKWVNVPPIETFTNNRPSITYFRRSLGLEVVNWGEQERAVRHGRRLGSESAQHRTPNVRIATQPGGRHAPADRGDPSHRGLAPE